jgi:hypothetical protein
MNTKELKSYILGYMPGDDVVIDNLVEFPDKKTADSKSEEWCEVLGTSLDDAKIHYEMAFARWQQKEGLTVGNPYALTLPYYEKL